MKKKFSTIITLTCISAVTSFFLTGACATQDKGSTPELNAADQPVYSVPVEKTQKWEKIQKMVKREQHVCAEHCGYEANCLDRCKKVYKSRMDREYQKLMHE
jgi:hypothetical protein